MQPCPARAIASPNTWLGSSVPCRFRAITGSMPSTGRSKKESPGASVAAGMLPPAALTRMSSRPHCSRTESRAGFELRRGRAHRRAGPVLPRPRPRWPRRRPPPRPGGGPARRPSRPARASPRASTPPSTPVPPVTTATWPARLNNCRQRCRCCSGSALLRWAAVPDCSICPPAMCHPALHLFLSDCQPYPGIDQLASPGRDRRVSPGRRRTPAPSRRPRLRRAGPAPPARPASRSSPAARRRGAPGSRQRRACRR